MSPAVLHTLQALCAVTRALPVGTNLSLLHFLWMQLSGTLLPSRGALFPALQAIGLAPAAVRRAWAAFRSGSWKISQLLRAWEAYVQGQGQWQAPSYEGYKPIAVDLTAYWRPTLKGWLCKHFHAEFWDHLVLPDVKVQPDNKTFTIGAIHDPRYPGPFLLACPLKISGAALHGLYGDRWPVEQIPLAAKQMLGGVRQFVFAPESCQRLPELNLLAEAMITYLSATLPAAPTGFWDRHPRQTPGRLRRLLARTPFPENYPLPAQLRKKNAVFDHLPKGIQAHRRTKQVADTG